MGKFHANWWGKWFCHAMVGIMLMSNPSLKAVESVTETFMATAKTIQGSGTNDSTLTCISTPIAAPVTSAGMLTAVMGEILQDSNANWTPSPFSEGASYYVEFDCGLMLDILSIDATSKTLTVAGQVDNLISAGDLYRIRKHLTLSDILGSNDEVVLESGLNPNLADCVSLINPQSQKTCNYFYSSVPNYSGWYTAEYTSADAQPVYPEQGLAIFRKAAVDAVLFLCGPIRDCSTLVPIVPGYNLVGTMQPYKAMKLSELNLYTGNPLTGLAAGPNPSAADNVMILTPDSKTRMYFYFDRSGYEGWYDWDYKVSNDVMIPAGSAFFINRKLPRQAFLWNVIPE